ncbi:NAD(P)-dependent oxidoreductase [Nonomuraea basaltis]|uniref:NAD(P)-dependent oxidoreductase n=1 Tax=Nonomuraea basaltis TaxID=2495887 RepID=UPI00110C43A5|nr:NAD(P)H-binding protein [Nonomuraea basaltis]TMR89302.1 NAD(P)-dependent oxidoreductase [Nonomuraea basaltis]
MFLLLAVASLALTPRARLTHRHSTTEEPHVHVSPISPISQISETEKGKPRMKLTIFGPTGRVGQHVLAQATAAGHHVTAVVRNPGKLGADAHTAPNVRIVTADLSEPDPGALESAVDGADAVLSGLGPRKKAEHGIVSSGTRAIADAIQAVGARRLIVVSGVGVSTVPTPSRPHPPKREPGVGPVMQYLTTPLAKRVLGHHFVDVALMEDFLHGCDADWTAMRVPLIVDKPQTGTYRTAYGHNLRAAFRIGQADAAQFMLQLIDQRQAVGKIVTIAY